MKDKIIDFILVSILIVALFGYVAIQAGFGGILSATATPTTIRMFTATNTTTSTLVPTSASTVTFTPLPSSTPTSTFTVTPTPTGLSTATSASITPTMPATRTP